MQGRKLSLGLGTMLAIFTVALFVTTSLAATEKVLHNFGSGKDGQDPNASLIWDAAGNLYGTTAVGGVYGYGTVFELTPKEDGGWTEKVLHNFGHGMDGTYPHSNLIWDAAGNLYGTTYWGGTHGYGTAFEMTLREDGGWTEKVLHNFGINGTDGTHPYSGLIFDAAGNLYGTTQGGGEYGISDGECPIGCGTVFELTPAEGGGWTEKVIHNFGFNSLHGVDGTNHWRHRCRRQSLRHDRGGRRSPGCGTVFEMTPRPGGGWTEKVIHNFGISDTDGVTPQAGLTLDAAGNLYGTTIYGGTYGGGGGGRGGGGTVFEVTPNEGGWTEKLLHSFGSGTDGFRPEDVLIFDAGGNLYGTTAWATVTGCSYFGCGTVFELTPTEGGGWTDKILHTFRVNGADGMAPGAGLIFDAAGNLYGTTTNGGYYPCTGSGCGTVFEVTP